MGAQLAIHRCDEAISARVASFETFTTLDLVVRTEAHPAASRFLKNETSVTLFFRAEDRAYVEALASSINALSDMINSSEEGEDNAAA